MKLSSCLLSAALLAVSLALDEDFDFEVTEDYQVEIDGVAAKSWNDKELTATAGKVFHLAVPRDAFGRNVDSYEAKLLGGGPLPLWLLFDKIDGVFWGVPLLDDVGKLHLVIRGLGGDKDITEEVIIKIVETSDPKDKCPLNEDSTVLTLLIDKGVKTIKPKQRVMAVNNISKFFGLPYSAFTLNPQLEKDDITDSSVILAGPGNLKGRSSKLTSLLQVPVGCDGRLWVPTASLVHQLKQQAKDGTIAEVVGLPVIGWRVKTQSRQNAARSKRQIDDYGSGDYEDYYDGNYDDEEYEDEEVDEATTGGRTTTTVTPTHPHRHHHGEVLGSEEGDDGVSIIREHHYPSSSPKMDFETDMATIPLIPETPRTTTTTTTTEQPTTTKVTSTVPTTPKVDPLDPNYDYDYNYDLEEDNEEDPIESKTIVPETSLPKQTETTTSKEISGSQTESYITWPQPAASSTPPTTTKKQQETVLPASTTTTTTTTERETTFMIVEDTEFPTVLYQETTSPTTTTTTPPSTTTVTTTTSAPVTTTTAEKQITTEEEPSTVTRQAVSRTTTVRDITESIEYEAKNFEPHIENRLKQMSVIAGKIFRFVVPKDTFNDLEDGHDLALELLNAKGEPLTKDSWLHFNPLRREIYGLPLEEDVSKWEYILKATDREGASVSDKIIIQVQQHKLQRVVNHEISLYLRIEKHQEFPHFVDWSLKTLRALGRIYNTNMSEITVRHINYTSEPVIFTWTNDSLPTSDCPARAIDELFKMLTANDRGDPSEKLSQLLAPELRAKKVTKRGLGVCETPQVVMTPPTNFRPFLRNPIDRINATVGELLLFKVPPDTFYDPEDVDGRTLNISLLTADRQSIKTTNWLQFDTKNREFYGIPRKAGRSEYQLVCVDNGGAETTDSLEIMVYPAPKVNYNVEFSMTVETPFDAFVNSASLQRKFTEKLQEIFEDRNTSFIQMNPFKQKQDATIVTWYNKSLSVVKCPHEEITRLESMLKNHHDRSVSSRVNAIMDPEFPVSAIKVLTMGKCRLKSHVASPPTEDVIPLDEKSSETNADEYQYLMTFIVPAVVISAMLFLAAVAACVLYRRRRTGKMNVEEDGRSTYGNKGIPVIFQEELEEKPESGTKAPVILKDEKPPLAPPEYSKSGSLKDDSEPYQPPPPFTRTQDNGRQPRPKPTPTYRKPPPYVPP